MLCDDLHPSYAAHTDRLVNRDGLTVADLPVERAKIAANFPAPDDAVDHSEHAVTSADGHAVRVIVALPPTASGPRPGILWIHGGGYMMGAPEMDLARIDRWVVEHGCVVVSPDYRLAPDSAYPAGVNDCFATLEWMAGNAEQLNVDPRRIVVAGMSAGGGLAAAVVLIARDRTVIELCGQVLLCPMLDDRFLLYPSSKLTVPSWTKKANLLGWTSYLGDLKVPPPTGYAVAARAASLENLPPTFIGVAGLDVLRDEAIAYARRLLDASVPVDVHLYLGAPHGFPAVAPQAPQSENIESAISIFLDTYLHSR